MSTAPSPPVDEPALDRPRLWHFTCRDAAPKIDADGYLRPNRHPWLPEPVVWLTDLDEPDRLALGLGNLTGLVSCDRAEFRYEVLDQGPVVRWTTYARQLVREGLLDRAVRERLDSTPGGLPAHWYVALLPVRARRN